MRRSRVVIWRSIANAAAWPVAPALVAAAALAWALAGAGPDAPWIDDWVYAWSVEHLLETGRVAVLPISAIYPVGQVLWATPFAWAAGFSFAALRVSTLVLAGLGCWSLYSTLRELGCSQRTSSIGACALAAHPVFFAMSTSFMTEVPFVALSMASLRWSVRAVIRGDRRALWTGCGFALWAFLVRPIGLLLPIAVLPALLFDAPAGGRRHFVAAPMAAVSVMVALQWLMPRWLGPLDWAEIRSGYLGWWFSVPIRSYLAWTVEVFVQASFPLAPLLMSGAIAARRWPTMLVAAAVLPAAAWTLGGEVPTPMPHGQTWSLEEISARAMLPGGVPGHAWAMAAQPWLMAAGAVVAGALLALVAPTPGGTRPAPRSARAGMTVIGSYGVLQLAATHLLWLYNDRYYLVFAPVIAVVAARALDGRPRAQITAICGLVGWLFVAATGTRDMLSVNRAAADAVRDLEASGVAPHLVDAGYALNGWRLYAHPDQLPPGVDRATGVPGVTSGTTPEGAYVVSTRPIEGTSVWRTLPLPAVIWQSTSALYVVRR